MKHLNKSQITVVRQCDKLKHRWVRYVKTKEEKLLSMVITKSKVGFTDDYEFYFEIHPFQYYQEKYNNSIYQEDNIVYYYPHLEIQMSDKSVHTKRFKTVEELEKWREENLQGINLIKM